AGILEMVFGEATEAREERVNLSFNSGRGKFAFRPCAFRRRNSQCYFQSRYFAGLRRPGFVAPARLSLRGLRWISYWRLAGSVDQAREGRHSPGTKVALSPAVAHA